MIGLGSDKNVKSYLVGTRLGMKSKFEAQTFEFDILLWFVDLLLFSYRQRFYKG